MAKKGDESDPLIMRIDVNEIMILILGFRQFFPEINANQIITEEGDDGKYLESVEMHGAKSDPGEQRSHVVGSFIYFTNKSKSNDENSQDEIQSVEAKKEQSQKAGQGKKLENAQPDGFVGTVIVGGNCNTGAREHELEKTFPNPIPEDFFVVFPV